MTGTYKQAANTRMA